VVHVPAAKGWKISRSTLTKAQRSTDASYSPKGLLPFPPSLPHFFDEREAQSGGFPKNKIKVVQPKKELSMLSYVFFFFLVLLPMRVCERVFLTMPRII
jgi:hypothetical protein